jgi:hypothetical protein
MSPDDTIWDLPQRDRSEAAFKTIFESLTAKYSDLIMEYERVDPIDYKSADIFTEDNLYSLLDSPLPAAKLQVRIINELKRKYEVDTAEEAYELYNNEKDIQSATSIGVLINISSPFTHSKVDIINFKLRVYSALAEAYSSAVKYDGKTYADSESQFQTEYEDIDLIEVEFPTDWVEGIDPSKDEQLRKMAGSKSVQLKDGLFIVFE